MQLFRNRVPQVALIEPPGIQLARDGILLNPLLLRYPKYQLLLLASCIAAKNLAEVSIVDLKGSAKDVNRISDHHTESIAYEGGVLKFTEIGLSLDFFSKTFSSATVIGISATYSAERRAVLRIISRLRRMAPEALIVVGGHDATVAFRSYLNGGAHLCVLGDGETVFEDILLAKSWPDLRKIQGVAYSLGGVVFKNGRRPRTAPGEIVFPSVDLLRTSHYDEYPDGPWPTGVGPGFSVLEFSRGCDEGCSFCSSTYVSGRYRSFSTQTVLSQLANIQKAGVTTLLIPDDNLLYRLKREYGDLKGRRELIDVFTEMRRQGFSWTFYNGIQFGLLENEGAIDSSLVDALFAGGFRSGKYVGCFEAYIPLERFSRDDQAPEFSKLPKAAKSAAILRRLSQTGVHRLNLGFIVGRPQDTRDVGAWYFDEASALGEVVSTGSGGETKLLYLPWCSVPLPNTPDRKRFSGSIAYSLDQNPELHNNYVSVLRGIGMSPGDFTEVRRQLDVSLNLLNSGVVAHTRDAIGLAATSGSTAQVRSTADDNAWR